MGTYRYSDCKRRCWSNQPAIRAPELHVSEYQSNRSGVIAWPPLLTVCSAEPRDRLWRSRALLPHIGCFLNQVLIVQARLGLSAFC